MVRDLLFWHKDNIWSAEVKTTHDTNVHVGSKPTASWSNSTLTNKPIYDLHVYIRHLFAKLILFPAAMQFSQCHKSLSLVEGLQWDFNKGWYGFHSQINTYHLHIQVQQQVTGRHKQNQGSPSFSMVASSAIAIDWQFFEAPRLCHLLQATQEGLAGLNTDQERANSSLWSSLHIQSLTNWWG